MHTDLQKASFGKRIIAGIFDGIFISILAVGIAALLSFCFGYNGYMDTVNDTYLKYEAEYGVEFKITADEFNALTDNQKENYNTAYEALTKDPDLVYAYNMLISLTVLILTFSILPSVIIVDFVAPIFFGNGQTLGKKIFGIALMNTESVKVTRVQLFARAVLGKFAIEIMIPLTIIMMIFMGSIGILGTIILAAILILEIACIISSRTNSLIHDLLANTIAVDMASQKIFETREELIEYTKAYHAEKAANSTY